MKYKIILFSVLLLHSFTALSLDNEDKDVVWVESKAKIDDLVYLSGESDVDQQKENKIPDALISLHLPEQLQLNRKDTSVKDPLSMVDLHLLYHVGRGLFSRSADIYAIVDGNGHACKASVRVIDTKTKDKDIIANIEISYEFDLIRNNIVTSIDRKYIAKILIAIKGGPDTYEDSELGYFTFDACKLLYKTNQK